MPSPGDPPRTSALVSRLMRITLQAFCHRDGDVRCRIVHTTVSEDTCFGSVCVAGAIKFKTFKPLVVEPAGSLRDSSKNQFFEFVENMTVLSERITYAFSDVTSLFVGIS